MFQIWLWWWLDNYVPTFTEPYRLTGWIWSHVSYTLINKAVFEKDSSEPFSWPSQQEAQPLLSEEFPLLCVSIFPLRLKGFPPQVGKVDELPGWLKKFSLRAVCPSVSTVSLISVFETSETPTWVTEVLAGVKDVKTASSLSTLFLTPQLVHQLFKCKMLLEQLDEGTSLWGLHDLFQWPFLSHCFLATSLPLLSLDLQAILDCYQYISTHLKWGKIAILIPSFTETSGLPVQICTTTSIWILRVSILQVLLENNR